jgi:hypothetical protein
VAGEFHKRYQFQLPNGIKNGSRLNSGPPVPKIVKHDKAPEKPSAGQSKKGNKKDVSRGISNVPGDDFVPNPSASKPYSRPSGAGPTSAQRVAVQGKPCVECGKVTPKQVADHIDPLSVQHYRDGAVDIAKQTKLEAVQPHCPDCSAKQGGFLSAFSKRMKSLFGW